MGGDLQTATAPNSRQRQPNAIFNVEQLFCIDSESLDAAEKVVPNHDSLYSEARAQALGFGFGHLKPKPKPASSQQFGLAWLQGLVA